MRFRNNNGGEFDMKEFYLENAIIHLRTWVETPQQNAIVERKYQRILNVGRALKFKKWHFVKVLEQPCFKQLHISLIGPNSIIKSQKPLWDFVQKQI